MPTASNDAKAIRHLLDRAVENLYPSREAVEERLKSGVPMTVYLGVDPTGPSLHLGHAIALRKLAEFQRLGHKVILLIGDFTAMIGDPTDKLAARARLTREEVMANAKSYREQAGRIVDFGGKNPAEIKFNSEWLSKMSFADVVDLASHFTVQQMLERDMFRRRMSWRSTCPLCGHENYRSPEQQDMAGDEGHRILVSTLADETWMCKKCKKEYTPEGANDIHSPRPVYLHEFLYPLMQGYDSVAMDVDMEIGGNDQMFNMLAGRTLMREMKQKEKCVMTLKILADATGKKMGKTEGNVITLDNMAEDMYGKVMSWTDGMILSGFELCTDVPDEEIDDIKSRMDQGENPMEFKRRLAREIVTAFLSTDDAERAEEHFTTVHQKHETPDEVPTLTINGPMKLVDALVASSLVASKTEARRQIEQGAVKVNERVVTDVNAEVAPGALIQKGKRYFVKLVD